MEKYGHGGYYLITTTENNPKDNLNDYSQTIDWTPLKVIEHQAMTLNCDHKSPALRNAEMIEHFQDAKVQDALITLRLPEN